MSNVYRGARRKMDSTYFQECFLTRWIHTTLRYFVTKPFDSMKQITFLLFASVLAGCGSMPTHDPAFAPIAPAALKRPPNTTGAIYQTGYDIRLFEDQRARNIGDILTVNLVERTDAKKDADLDISKENSTSVSIPTLFGKPNAKIFGLEMETSLESAHEFKGEGESNQSNSLTGYVTVSVVAVLPNGNLKIRGEKRVTLNQGHEYIRVAGIVRPVDIDATNTVPSTKIADATIMYIGDGAVADASRMPWLARIFTSLLFPF